MPPTDARPKRLLNAYRRRPTDCTPVWLMRQAGRYQASYRAIRQRVSFFELCRDPDLASQVTVAAVEELGVDAAIIFSDILVPVVAMGVGVELTEEGPRITPPVRDRAAIEALQVFDPAEKLPFLLEAIRRTNRALAGRVPLLGFAGAPLTLASYLVEGGQSRHFIQLKRLLFGDPVSAHLLLDKLATMVVSHLRAQVEAGCHAVQVFDTWAGILSPDDYRELCLPHLQRIFAELQPLGVPRILFGTNTAPLLELLRESGADVIGVDWRIDLAEARRSLGPALALQGNLDPCCLWLDEPALERRVHRVLQQAGPAEGYVFNLGHGVLPGTPPERVRFLVETVHRLSARPGPATP
ncbi:MAG: uroporphyrinogen decarboxylase [Proteobacteria bacterium]|nr:uroporphyrinogen decarboxylase [Pseudomonadota bacterium]